MSSEQYRSIHGAELTTAEIGNDVRLAGWVGRRRDHGGVIFIDLRDASGIVQVVLNPEDAPAADDVLHGLRLEFCISVDGIVRARPDGTINPDLATGEIEVVASSLTVLSASAALPFQLDGRADVEEVRRLGHRYLDLRTQRMQANLAARSRAIGAMRSVMEHRGFLEVETPTLVASTPEGARDMLVPSRLRKGSFYALPQSPQLFKQLLMIGGVERYYQIARCYRDEDFRADRQVEFTQLDFEGAFWGQEDVLVTLEAIAGAVVEAVREDSPARPFPRLTHAEAMRRFGTDKPDIRFGMEILDLAGVFGGTGFKAFAGVLSSGGVVRGINAGQKGLSRAGMDALVDRAIELGAKGLVWMVVNEEGGLRSPITKFLSGDEVAALIGSMGASAGDLLLIVADAAPTVSSVLGQLRLEMGKPEGHDDLSFLFVVDFPVFERTADGDLVPAHHPFTAPVDVEQMKSRPDIALSKAYDLVLNGSELGSGSVRIHDPEVQAEVFEILNISSDDASLRFGWFLEALRYGTPPHAGFAIGVDRFVSILQDEPNIREVIAFPKTQSGADPLTGSPTRVEDAQLADLGLGIRPEVRSAWAEEESDAGG